MQLVVIMNIALREVSSETLQTFQNLLESCPRIFLAATIWTLLIITVLIRLQADLGYKPRPQTSHAKN